MKYLFAASFFLMTNLVLASYTLNSIDYDHIEFKIFNFSSENDISCSIKKESNAKIVEVIFRVNGRMTVESMLNLEDLELKLEHLETDDEIPVGIFNRLYQLSLRNNQLNSIGRIKRIR